MILNFFAAPCIAQELVATISRPGMRPYAIAVSESHNRLYVADNSEGVLRTYDAETLQEVNAVAIGKNVFEIVVDEARGRVYAGLDSLAVVEAGSGDLVRYVNSSGLLEPDFELERLYAYGEHGLHVVDLSSYQITAIPGVAARDVFFDDLAVNPVTHEVFIQRGRQNLMEIMDAESFEIDTVQVSGLALGVNWIENKVYVATGGGVGAPFHVLDRDTDQIEFVHADNDALKFLFDEENNTMYTSSEVNAVTSIIEGSSNEFFNLPMLDGAASLDLNSTTNHLYFVGSDELIVMDTETQAVAVLRHDEPEGGIVISNVAVNDETGRVYVVHKGFEEDEIDVWQDTPIITRSSVYVGYMYGVDPLSGRIVDEWNLTNPAVWGVGIGVRPGGGRLYLPIPFDNALGMYAGAGSFPFVDSTGTGCHEPPYGLDLTPTVPVVTPDGSRIYVTNMDCDNVGVIDAEKFTLIQTIPVDDGPYGAAMTAEGLLLVTNMYAGTVSVISTTTNTVDATIPVEASPIGVAVNPAGTMAYVASGSFPFMPGFLSVIDLPTRSVVATLDVASEPTWTAVSPDGRRVYLTTYGDAGLSVFDTGDDELLTFVHLGGRPEGIAPSPDGRIVWVGNERPSSNSLQAVETFTWSIATEVDFMFLIDGEAIAIPDQTARIAGRLLEGGHPVAAVRVQALQGGPVIGTTETNLRGDYSIHNLIPGVYDVEIGDNASRRRISDVVLQPGQTHILSFDISSVSAEDDIESAAPEFYPFYPDPASSWVKVRFRLSQDENVTATIFDVLGRALWSRSYGRIGAGEHEEVEGVGHLASGVYMLRLQAKEWIGHRSFTVAR